MSFITLSPIEKWIYFFGSCKSFISLVSDRSEIVGSDRDRWTAQQSVHRKLFIVWVNSSSQNETKPSPREIIIHRPSFITNISWWLSEQKHRRTTLGILFAQALCSIERWPAAFTNVICQINSINKNWTPIRPCNFLLATPLWFRTLWAKPNDS